MANRLFLQTILKFSDKIKDGSVRITDIVDDYFKNTGKAPTEEESAILLKEFQDNAPSGIEAEGVEEVFFGPGDTRLGGKTEAEKLAEDQGVDVAETILPTRGPNVQKAGDMSDTPFTDTLRKQNPDVEITGKESFDELMEKLGPADDTPSFIKDFDKNLDELSFARFNKAYKDLDIDEKDSILDSMKKIGDAVFGTKKEGIGSLFPKGKGAAFEKIDDRDEVAEFVRKMRGAGIKNPDIRGVFKEFGTDIEGGKRAATTLARAADMGADTKIKQEALSDLDDDIANYGPNWWRGEGMADGPMGFDSRQQATSNIITKINNGIVDDLERAGVDEEKVSFIFRNLSETRDRLKNDPKAFVQKVADELEFEDIDYDLTFWNKYVDEIMSRMQKPEPRFMYGGVV